MSLGSVLQRDEIQGEGMEPGAALPADVRARQFQGVVASVGWTFQLNGFTRVFGKALLHGFFRKLIERSRLGCCSLPIKIRCKLFYAIPILLTMYELVCVRMNIPNQHIPISTGCQVRHHEHKCQRLLDQVRTNPGS